VWFVQNPDPVLLIWGGGTSPFAFTLPAGTPFIRAREFFLLHPF